MFACQIMSISLVLLPFWSFAFECLGLSMSFEFHVWSTLLWVARQKQIPSVGSGLEVA